MNNGQGISKYQRNIILKGGFLVLAIVGLDTRATMEQDRINHTKRNDLRRQGN